MESYRIEKQATLRLSMEKTDATLQPVALHAGSGAGEPYLDALSNILKTFNDLFGNINWDDKDKVIQLMIQHLPQRVAQNIIFQNALTHADRSTARLEHNRLAEGILLDSLSDYTDVYRYYTDNPSFKIFFFWKLRSS